jgi:carbamoyl-phosphate synthase small subunit
MTGYQEILTDPSYAGQMVVMTAPQIGNTGVNPEDNESDRAHLHGFIVRELSPVTSSWRATRSLSNWLAEQGVIGISEIDTRALTRRLRDQGSQKGVLSTDERLSDNALVEQARAWSGLDGIDLVQEVTCADPFYWTEPNDAAWLSAGQKADRLLSVVAYDFGIKYNILRRLAAYNCRVTVVPAATPASQVLALKPDGVFLSNGPGDPAAVSCSSGNT